MEKIKEIAISEFVKNCIDNGELDQKMNELKQKASELGVTENELQSLINREIKNSAKANVIVKMAKKNKVVILAVILVLILLEWFLIFNPNPAEGESMHILLIIIVNVLTVTAVIIAYSAIMLIKLNRKNKTD